jgi:hypothetical protein
MSPWCGQRFLELADNSIGNYLTAAVMPLALGQDKVRT